MKKLKRSERLVDMTQYLLSKPHTLIPLTTFAERYGATKSSISEDLAIIKDVFESEGLGELQTLAGAEESDTFRSAQRSCLAVCGGAVPAASAIGSDFARRIFVHV